MPNNKTHNLFALIKDEKPCVIRRIPLVGAFGEELYNLFATQQKEFLKNKEFIEFKASYKIDSQDSNEIFTINNYTLPPEIRKAIENLMAIDVLNIDEEDIKALFIGTLQDAKVIVNFQSFDTRKLLDKRFALRNVISEKAYGPIEKTGLMLQKKLTACFNNGKLHFMSYHNTRRFLDLTNYYREATNIELKKFVDNDLFKCEDKLKFIEDADHVIRSKIALILESGFLEKVSVEKIEKIANGFNEVSLNIEENKIVIPSDNKKLKVLLRFLNEDYFISPLTNTRWETNSKKELTKK